MKITAVSIKKIEKDNFKGFADVTFDDCFVVKGIRIMDGKKGLFVAMPADYSEKDDEYYDRFFPITKEFREELSDAILDGYEHYEEMQEEKPKKRRR